MAEWFPGQNPDFSTLGEVPPPPPEKKPAKFELADDDDDDDVEEAPKTIRDYLEKKDEKSEETAESEEEEAEAAAEAEPESETDEETESDEEAEEEPASKEMSDDEVQEAAVEIVDSRAASAREEADEADSPEAEQEAQAAEAFLDNAKAEISKGQSVDEALEAAKSKTLEDLGLEAPDADEEPPADIELPNAEIPEPVEPEEPDETPPPIPVTGAGSPPAAAPPSPPRPPGGGLPPVPPLGGGFPGSGAPGGPGMTGGNVLPPLPAAPNVAPMAPEASVDRRGKGRYLLVGGIVGYMIGRRGGRLRTEAKLLPVQRKLEKEVAELHDKIFWHEASVRSLAHERAVKHPESAEQTAERLKAAKQAKEKQPTESKNERLDRFAATTERPSSPEALRQDVLKSVDDMTLPELLRIAEQIPIEESNLRRLFEANRLNDEGLRRILKAYLRGESYDKLLHENLIDDSTHERLAQNQPEIAPGLQYDDSQAVRQSVETYAPHAQSLHEKLQQAGADTPAPFAQWAEAEQKQTNNTALIAAVSVAVVVIVLILAFVLA